MGLKKRTAEVKGKGAGERQSLKKDIKEKSDPGGERRF